MPVIPLLAVYSAAAIVHRREIWQRHRTGTFGMAVACCVLIGLGWLRELVFVDFNLVKHFIT